jgi:hypothetical protein
MNTKRIKWTRELCWEEAKKYETRTDFSNGSGGAYNYALFNNILDNICDHMKQVIRWTSELVTIEALKYNTRGEFHKENGSAYLYANKHGLLDEVCSHMKQVIRWNSELVKQEAIKYNTKSDFKKGNCGAYLYAKRNNLLVDICSHMVSGHYKWDHISVKEEALKYSRRTEFSTYSSGAYEYARVNNILDDVCSHMKIIGNLKRRCIYVCCFPDNYCYIGLTCDIDKRMSRRRRDMNDAVTIHKNLTKLEYKYIKLTEYVDAEEASKLEHVYVEYYKNMSWNILNRTKTGGLGGNEGGKYKYDYLREEALKYKTKKEFIKGNRSCYDYCCRHKILGDVCSHMESGMGKWRYNSVKLEALKYKGRKAFRLGSGGAYNYARRHNLLDELFPKEPNIS